MQIAIENKVMSLNTLKENSKPRFPFDFGPDEINAIFSGKCMFSDAVVVTPDVIKELKNDKYIDVDIDIELLLNWKISIYSNSCEAVNDGDYYEYGITVESPDGFKYGFHDETCMAVGEEFGEFK